MHSIEGQRCHQIGNCAGTPIYYTTIATDEINDVRIEWTLERIQE